MLLSQLFLTGMSTFQLEFHGHADLLHISLPLFNFVTRGAFTNHGDHPAVRRGEFMAGPPSKAWGIGVRL